jgi:hypothetical protein
MGHLGIGGAKSFAWLQLFPGKYGGLSYGTVDALGCTNAAHFCANYFTMVQPRQERKYPEVRASASC